MKTKLKDLSRLHCFVCRGDGYGQMRSEGATNKQRYRRGYRYTTRYISHRPNHRA